MGEEKVVETDVCVVGGGMAGCTAAIELANAGQKVSLFVKKRLVEDSNSYLLAGGLAAVSIKNLEGDNFLKHINDTLSAGKGLNSLSVVKMCCENFFDDGIKWLIEQGVLFDLKNGTFSLHKEGGHSENRVYHNKDITGKSIIESLTSNVLKNENITVFENHIVIDLIVDEEMCNGVYVYDEESDCVKTFSSKGVFLATGSLGKIFKYTSNSDVATGDGFAMCYRKGLSLANMEFIQFHPTVFYDPSLNEESERRFLLTEALRGAGAILKTSKDSKEDFVLRFNSLGSRSTRDVVSRAEDVVMREEGLEHVWLDCTMIPEEKIKNEFTNSYEFCLSKGYDITKESIPVVYAVHYSNGGVLVDSNSETKIQALYVLGETSYTGLHGATRLASNSGSECILFSRYAAKHFLENYSSLDNLSVPEWDVFDAKESKDKALINYYWDIIRRTMTSLCGVSRTEERLLLAKGILEKLKDDVLKYYWSYFVTRDFLEVRNILDVSLVVVNSAILRRETRASHFREDFSELNEEEFHKLTVVSQDFSGFVDIK